MVTVSLTDGRKHSAGRALIEKGFSGSREASEGLQEEKPGSCSAVASH